MVQIWYPAETGGNQQYYRSNTPSNLRNSHLRLVKLHSRGGAIVAQTQKRYPVLIFSPAWTGNCNQYTFLAEELASAGFIVVGIDHPYGSDPTAFPDGRIIRTALDKWLDYSSDDALAARIRVAEHQLQIRTADVQFVLDELERLDSDDPTGFLSGRIDANRVGVFGHSFGGAVAAEACNCDARFKAGIDFDGLLFGKSKVDGVSQPFLFVSDDTPLPTDADLKHATGPRRRYLAHLDSDVHAVRHSLSAHGGYWLTIHGASHSNFTDGPLYSPIKRLTGAGPIDARRAQAIINEYARAFFEKHLLSQDSGVLSNSAPRTGEVTFDTAMPCGDFSSNSLPQ